MPLRSYVALLFTIYAVTNVAADASAEDLVVFFNDRAPYFWRDDTDNVRGIVAEPAERALAASGTPFIWEELPSARQIETIKRNEMAACGLGWYKRPDREEFARFSDAIYRDSRMVVIARKHDPHYVDNPPIATLFADPGLTLLVKVGYSYGTVMDAKIAAGNPNRVSTSTDNLHMLDMIALGRADYMLMSAEEADYLLNADGHVANALASYPFQDAPEGEPRHLMCTMQVPRDLLDRFNAALDGQ